MLTSQNGFSANDRTLIGSYTVPGTTLRVSLRKGDVSAVLLEFLRRYHLEVEPLYNTPQDLWGYAARTIRGSSTVLSNHASGTAVDVRATAHPLGVRGTFPPQKLAALRRLLNDFGGVLRWGGDYSQRPDEMHIEVNASPAQVQRLADAIRAHNASIPAPARPATASPVGDPVQTFTWPAGTGTHKLVCPTGTASRLVARAWLSLACDGEISSYDVWFQGDTGGLTEFHGRVGKDTRQWWELPDGCTQITVHYTATGPVGAALEMQAK